MNFLCWLNSHKIKKWKIISKEDYDTYWYIIEEGRCCRCKKKIRGSYIETKNNYKGPPDQYMFYPYTNTC